MRQGVDTRGRGARGSRLDYDHRSEQFLQHPFFRRELEVRISHRGPKRTGACARAVPDRMGPAVRNLCAACALQIHWLSILNSVILVILLTSFLFIILMRVLRNDYARYSAVEMDPEDGTAGHAAERGWVGRRRTSPAHRVKRLMLGGAA